MAKYEISSFIFILLVSRTCIGMDKGNFVNDKERLLDAEQQCYENHLQLNEMKGLHCKQTWDGWGCWPDTPVGKTAVRPCPGYIKGFDTKLHATKVCLPTGDWYKHSASNLPWSNYTMCHRMETMSVSNTGNYRRSISVILFFAFIAVVDFLN